MTFEIQLPPDIEALYAAEASAKGVPLERHIVERLIASAPIPLSETGHLNVALDGLIYRSYEGP